MENKSQRNTLGLNVLGLIVLPCLFSTLARGQDEGYRFTETDKKVIQIPLPVVKSGDLYEARMKYLKECEKLSNELSKSKVYSFVRSTVCSDPQIQDNRSTITISGYLQLSFRRPMKWTLESLDTGFIADKSKAQSLYTLICKNFLYQGSQNSAKTLLFQTCGTKSEDLFYEKPRFFSTAFRIEKYKTHFRTTPYCQCRHRQVEERTFDPDGYEQIYFRNLYDLMLLNEEGYYDRGETFSSREFCEDEMNKTAVCAD